MKIVGEASTASESIAAVARTQPEFVLMDVRLPDGSGVAAARDIRNSHPQVKILRAFRNTDGTATVS
jgi:DNA-binding NarL/FixJ family response regulator